MNTQLLTEFQAKLAQAQEMVREATRSASNLSCSANYVYEAATSLESQADEANNELGCAHEFLNELEMKLNEMKEDEEEDEDDEDDPKRWLVRVFADYFVYADNEEDALETAHTEYRDAAGSSAFVDLSVEEAPEEALTLVKSETEYN